MNSVLIIYFAIFLLFLCINRMFRNTYFDAFFFVAAPYVAIILINNAIMVNYGFSRIPDYVVRLHLYAMIVFYLGTSIGQICGKRIKTNSDKRPHKLTDYKLKTTLLITCICELIIILDDISRLSRYGLANFINGGETFGSSSVAAHLSRLLVPLIIVCFDYYFEKKNKKILPVIITGLLLLFATFIKYHIISAILAIFIYMAIKRPYLIKWLSVTVIALIIILFTANYMVTFSANKVSVSNEFYFLHFWQYIAGGTINIENASIVFKWAFSEEMSITSWIFEMLTCFPSMLTNRLLGFRFTGYVFSEMLPFFRIGGNSVSNVLSIPGAAYIQSDLLGLLIFSFFSGILVQFVYIKARNTKSVSTLNVTSIFLSYCMLSFFSSFFELPGPWETMFWSILILPVLTVEIKNGKLIIKKPLMSIHNARLRND